MAFCGQASISLYFCNEAANLYFVPGKTGTGSGGKAEGDSLEDNKEPYARAYTLHFPQPIFVILISTYRSSFPFFPCKPQVLKTKIKFK